MRNTTRLASFLLTRSHLAVLLLILPGLLGHTLARAPVPAPHKNYKNDKHEENDKNQEKPYALIAGTVWGPDSRPVYGAKVRIRRADQKKLNGNSIPIIAASSFSACPPAPPITSSGLI